MDSGHNVLLGVNSDVSETMRSLAAEFGVDLDDRGTKVYDHFQSATLDGKEDPTLIAASDLVDAPVIVGGPYKVGREGQREERGIWGQDTAGKRSGGVRW